MAGNSRTVDAPFEPFVRWMRVVRHDKPCIELSREDLFREGYLQALRDVDHKYRPEPTKPHRYEPQLSISGSVHTWCAVCGQARAHELHSR